MDQGDSMGSLQIDPADYGKTEEQMIKAIIDSYLANKDQDINY